MRKTGVVISFLALCLSLAVNPNAQAADKKYPSKPITFIVPFGPGATTDVCWRTLGEEVRSIFGVSINAVNKPGSGGLTGTDAVAYSKPDGYTLLAGNATCMTVAPAIDPKTYRDLVPIAVVARQPILVVTRTEHEIKTLEDMIRRGKEQPETLTVGTTGITSSTYFDLQLLEIGSGARFIHVPIGNSSEGVANLLGGHMDFWFGSFSIVESLLRAKRLRGIATCSPERSSAFPDIPTFAEKGYPDVNINLTMTLYGPKGTPPEVIKAWEDALTVVMGKPQVNAALKKLTFEVELRTGTEKLMRFLQNERENVTKIVKAKGIKP